uniref:Dihydrolipoamide dehydrogenase n=1 Tax=Candidatus Kentrum sp. TC TaxID=2126339 RepID=A0A451ACR0_9GAMM|nr:MAG: dihydrolipoamide dehydrogenase [Candidatus Kentron sp. TC]VFK63818.1 MAG: dihydrolipoamide dehydrogenase [Candidatus Kentron sp. TC]
MAAIRAAQLGLKVACVDRRFDAQVKSSPGGTCRNVRLYLFQGMLDSFRYYYDLLYFLPAHGIRVDGEIIKCARDADAQG